MITTRTPALAVAAVLVTVVACTSSNGATAPGRSEPTRPSAESTPSQRVRQARSVTLVCGAAASGRPAPHDGRRPHPTRLLHLVQSHDHPRVSARRSESFGTTIREFWYDDPRVLVRRSESFGTTFPELGYGDGGRVDVVGWRVAFVTRRALVRKGRIAATQRILEAPPSSWRVAWWVATPTLLSQEPPRHCCLLRSDQRTIPAKSDPPPAAAPRNFRTGASVIVGAGSLGSSCQNSRMVVPEVSDRRAKTLGWWCRKSRIVVPKLSDGGAGSLGSSTVRSRSGRSGGGRRRRGRRRR